jgi:hypothetical protein
VKITNTQLAAALEVLGYEILPSTNYSTCNVVFDFHDYPEVERYAAAWRKFSAPGTLPKEIDDRLDAIHAGPEDRSDPLPLFFRVARAREWIVKQVIHGSHNEDLELPPDTVKTCDLHMAIWLVAQGQYLLRLDKGQREFHFNKSAAIEVNGCEPGSDYYYCQQYLKTLEQLVRRISNRNITRQQNQTVIPCRQ